MLVEIQVPELGESISEATVSNWLKQAGDAVEDGETLVELETDKVMVEVPAANAGVLAEILKAVDETVHVGDVLCKIDPEGQAAAAEPAAASDPEAPPPATQPASAPQTPAAHGGAVAPAPGGAEETLTPAARRMAAQHGLDAASIPGTGRRGQVTKGDVIDFVERAAQRPAARPDATPAASAVAAANSTAAASPAASAVTLV